MEEEGSGRDCAKDRREGRENEDIRGTPRPIPIVLVCRNNLHLSKLAVRSALAQDVPVEVLVVDNCSTDGTAQWLATKPVVTIFPREQLSLAACWNAALKALWRAGHDRALVINNDVEILPITVRYLSAWIQGSTPFVTCVSVATPNQITDPLALSWSYHTREHPDFSCFMIHKSVTDRIGWFDEDMYPAYCEDSDYHVRMHRAGIRAVCVDVPFLHHGAGTVKNAAPGEVAKIRRGADQNRERFRQKYGCLPGSKEYEDLFCTPRT